jgi:glutamate racemase
MDNRPIGVFDSGLGGLTTVRRLIQVLPHEDVIYLGDTGRVPYGSRSKDTIIRYAMQDAAFLKQFDIKTLVVACGTVSTTALQQLRDSSQIPVYGVVDATVSAAAAATKNGKIGAIGTMATIRSNVYKSRLEQLLPDVQYRGKACPLFVPLVENGRTKPGDVVIETVAAEYLEEFKQWGADTLILGCTHYPLLSDVIGNFMGSGVTLIDAGAATAEFVAAKLRQGDMLADSKSPAEYKYYVTDSTEGFVNLASMFLQTDHLGAVEQVSLDNF